MGMDIRTPIGLMFAVLGALMLVYGAVSDRALYERSLGLNVNLWWGVVLLVFGGIMLLLGRRGASTMRTASASPQGSATEAMEKRTGKEGGRPHGH